MFLFLLKLFLNSGKMLEDHVKSSSLETYKKLTICCFHNTLYNFYLGKFLDTRKYLCLVNERSSNTDGFHCSSDIEKVHTQRNV